MSRANVGYADISKIKNLQQKEIKEDENDLDAEQVAPQKEAVGRSFMEFEQ